MIDTDVAVIGGGPAAIAAAREAAKSGAAVALIESGAIGGRAAHTTTVALRVMTRAADAGEKDWRAVQNEIAARIGVHGERLAFALEDAGVSLVRARARFASARELVLDDGEKVRFSSAIVASGAAPKELPGARPDGVRLLVPDALATLDALPPEVMVIGGGAAGAEISDVLSRFGSRVTWVMDELGILPSFDRELAEGVGDVLMERGVKLVHGKKVLELSIGQPGVMAKLDGGRTYAAPLALCAVGNRPHTAELELGAAGLDAAAIHSVDAHCRTRVPHIFAAGDVTTISHDVASGESMGRVAGRMAARGEPLTFRREHAPRSAYTRPEAAQVGLTPDRAAGREVLIHTLRLEETLFGQLAHIGERADAKGLVRLVCSSDEGRLLGAAALGTGAIEIVSAAALAMSLGATDRDLASFAAGVPSYLDALTRAVR